MSLIKIRKQRPFWGSSQDDNRQHLEGPIDQEECSWIFYYECMIGKSADSLDPPRSRKTKVKRLHDCSMKMIVKHLADSVVVYTTTESQHSHSLDNCDRLRHPRVVSAIIKTETQGRDDWSSASVAHNLSYCGPLWCTRSRDYLNASVDYKKVCNARRTFLPKSIRPNSTRPCTPVKPS